MGQGKDSESEHMHAQPLQTQANGETGVTIDDAARHYESSRAAQKEAQRNANALKKIVKRNEGILIKKLREKHKVSYTMPTGMLIQLQFGIKAHESHPDEDEE